MNLIQNHKSWRCGDEYRQNHKYYVTHSLYNRWYLRSTILLLQVARAPTILKCESLPKSFACNWLLSLLTSLSFLLSGLLSLFLSATLKRMVEKPTKWDGVDDWVQAGRIWPQQLNTVADSSTQTAVPHHSLLQASVRSPPRNHTGGILWQVQEKVLPASLWEVLLETLLEVLPDLLLEVFPGVQKQMLQTSLRKVLPEILWQVLEAIQQQVRVVS